MVSEEVIRTAARRLMDAAQSPSRVILCGSHARGDAGADSDLDFLVIERDVADRFGETEWGEVRNTMLHAALQEGRVVAEA